MGKMCNTEKVVHQTTIFFMKNSNERVYIGISAGN